MEMKYFLWKKMETVISYFGCGLFERRHVSKSPRLLQSPYYPLWTTVDKILLFNDSSGNWMTSCNPKWRLPRKSDIDIAFICFQFQIFGSCIPCFRPNFWNDIFIYIMPTHSTSGGGGLEVFWSCLLKFKFNASSSCPLSHPPPRAL